MKIYRKPFFLLIFLICITNVSGQDIKLLEGRIMTDSLSPVNLHVINLNLGKGTTSDASGKFEIYSRINDTLLISSVQFQRKKIVVSEENYNSGKISIFVVALFNELNEIQLSDLKLSGYLQEDAPRIKIIERSQFGIPYPQKRPTQTERQLYTASSSAGGIPLDLLLNTINGKIKMLKKVKANDELKVAVEKAEDLVGREFFLYELKLPEGEIINFLYYCAWKPGFRSLLDSGDTLKLIEFFKDNKGPFLELRDLEEE